MTSHCERVETSTELCLRLMSARALCRVAALRLLPLPPRKEVQRAKFHHWDHEHHKEKEEEVQPGPRVEGYTVQYNPAAYQVRQGVAASKGADQEEELPPLTLAPPFRQQSNPYSVCTSRRLSSAKNTLLDLAFSRGGDSGKETAAPLSPAEDLSPSFNPRAFQKCRPEYGAVSHDLSQRPPTIPTEEAFLLLHKVKVLKGSLGPAEVAHFLSELGRLAPEQLPLARADTRFSMLLRYGVESLRRFSAAQLLEALRAFVLLGLPATHGVLGLYEAELVWRAGEMEPQQLLLAADLWRCLGRPVPQYLERLYGCAATWAWARLGPAELVQLIYLMGEGRHCPASLLLPLELQLLRHLDQLTAEEVGAVSLGLFKSQSGLSEGTVRRLVDRAREVVQEMSDYALVNVLKLLRFGHLDHLGLLGSLGEEIPRRAPRMGIQGLMHVALGCSALHYRDDRVLEAIADCLPSLAPQCRSKDAGKLLWAFGTLGFPPSQAPRLFPSLTQALRQREAEFKRFPEHLLTGLLGLAFAGLFPADLLTLALSPDFVSLAASSRQLELKKDLFTLDGSVGLELPGWTGPRVSRALAQEVTQQLWQFALQDVCRKPEVLEAEQLLQELLGGEGFVRKHMILPHTRSIDLEVRLDSAGHPLPLRSEPGQPSTILGGVSAPQQSWEGGHIGVTITEDLLAQLTNIKPVAVKPPAEPPHSPTLHRIPEREQEGAFLSGVDLTEGLMDTLRRPAGKPQSPKQPPPCSTSNGVLQLAVQVSNRNQYCYRTQQLLGLHALKRRQLALAGYRVVELPPWEWFPLLRRSRAEKLDYLRAKIFG
ncbi:hypothetical protein MATL_G00084340 [Megalops atlanticus]|uniref:RAP domain-containing protein n=1 Tax=Megalops atlanticus TaxID=7932 RepID=A0A9D3Q4C9_MEGAT|nr:hypothetical protein MATL_G00084340 [Megalops atlanticus]